MRERQREALGEEPTRRMPQVQLVHPAFPCSSGSRASAVRSEQLHPLPEQRKRASGRDTR
ncbi:hypothetical protein JOF41_003574 [Saccharothrix coeruleofusca]|nr:hypothetical protein [Saccharothrix coeruleofusca]